MPVLVLGANQALRPFWNAFRKQEANSSEISGENSGANSVENSDESLGDNSCEHFC